MPSCGGCSGIMVGLLLLVLWQRHVALRAGVQPAQALLLLLLLAAGDRVWRARARQQAVQRVRRPAVLCACRL
jgi:hypothetical protein